LAAAYRVLAYVRGTVSQGIYLHDPGIGKRNILSGWVDSDFAADVDTRKSVTEYLWSLNGGPISCDSSWKAARQGGVTLSRSEAEFVAAVLQLAKREKKFRTCVLSSKGLPALRPSLLHSQLSCGRTTPLASS
jgi:hypothetical protein